MKIVILVLIGLGGELKMVKIDGCDTCKRSVAYFKCKNCNKLVCVDCMHNHPCFEKVNELLRSERDELLAKVHKFSSKLQIGHDEYFKHRDKIFETLSQNKKNKPVAGQDEIVASM